MNTSKRFALTFIFLLACFAASSQDAVSKAIASANTHLLVREYDKAYPYTTFLIRFFSGKEMSLEALDTCERVIAAYSYDLREKGKIEELATLEKAIAAAPASVRAKASENIAWAKKAIEEKKAAEQKNLEEQRRIEAEQRRLAEIDEAIRLEKQKEAENEARREKERLAFEQRETELRREQETLAEKQRTQLDSIIQQNRQLEERKEQERVRERLESQNLQVELERQRLDAEKHYREELSRIMEMNKQSGEDAFRTVSRTSMAMIVGLGIVGLIVLIGVVIVVLLYLRQQAIQQQQFQNTIAVMTSLRNAQADMSAIALPFMSQQLQALPGGQTLMIEQKKGAPNESSVMNTPEELKALHAKCDAYADQIDEVTNRKNASRRVAELVYKISKSMGYSEHDALLYYLVGLIYDIGFLNIDPVILRSEHITEEQFNVIKTHATIGTNMVFFIDEKNRSLFKDGVSKHHENLDGSGYPSGLKGDEIPFIARVLRVAETYIALVSSRDYKSIKDRDSALRELYEQKNQYDEDIVKTLDGIV